MALTWPITMGGFALGLGALALFMLAGGRLFIIETPSMGAAAPVGALVVTQPIGNAPIRVGEVITFQVPDSTTTWTHRAVAVDPGGEVRTQGDVNAAPDPWSVAPEQVVGRVVAALPYVGWLVRGTPFVIGITFASWLVTSPLRDRAMRTSFRLLGATVAVVVALSVLNPLVDVRLLATRTVTDGVEAVVVSTGALPTRVSDDIGRAIHLEMGEVGNILLPRQSEGAVVFTSRPDLGPPGWAALIGISLIPLVLSLSAAAAQRIGPATRRSGRHLQTIAHKGGPPEGKQSDA